MTEQHGKLLTCPPFSYLSLSMEPFFFLVYNNGSISVPIPPKCHCGVGFSSSPLMALSLNVTSSVHFSYNPTCSKSLWEWKTKEAEEKNGGKIRNKGHLTYRAIWQGPGGSRDHMLCPWPTGLQKSSPWFETGISSKLCTANYFIFQTFSKYMCKTACKVFKAESVERPLTSWRILEWGPAHWKTML